MVRTTYFLISAICVLGLQACEANPQEEPSLAVDAGSEALPELEKYAGGWYKALCADEIQGTGTREGDIVQDFMQMDQFGEDLRLYDFCDRHVWLVGSAYW